MPAFCILDTLCKMQHVALTVYTFWFPSFSIWASFVRIILSTDETLLLRPTVFGQMSETLAAIATAGPKSVFEILPPHRQCQLLGRLSFGKLVPRLWEGI